MNGKSLKGLFHEDVVRSLRELPEEVCIVCARKASGPSPLRGTIVDNVDTGKSQQAFASRVSLNKSGLTMGEYNTKRTMIQGDDFDLFSPFCQHCI